MSKKSLFLRCLSLLCLLWAFAAEVGFAATATSMRLVKSVGTVVVRDSHSKAIQPFENLALYDGYRINTREDGYCWINFDDDKLAKLDVNSSITIRKDGNALTITVDSGQLFFDIAKPLAAGE